MPTIPDRHPYVHAVLGDAIEHVVVDSGTDLWAPSPLLAPHGSDDVDTDVVHVHFGYESLSSSAMSDWCRRVRATGKALVVTVHDLRNPHDLDPRAHDAHLTSLLAEADEVITLTPGAADRIARRWGRRATVLAHPTLRKPRAVPPRSSDRPVVGVHLKGLRTNVLDAERLVEAIVIGARRCAATVRVDVHPGALDPAARTRLDRVVDDLRVHDRFDDEGLERYLRSIDVSVLPYRFGSHSGWLELCRDLGTTVVVPDCGFYAEQWPVAQSYGNNEVDGLDDRSLAEAVVRAVTAEPPAPADPAQRLAERSQIRAAHTQIYRRAVATARRRDAA